MNDSFLQKQIRRILRFVMWFAIFFGSSFFLVRSCTSPDAVYASIQRPEEIERTIYYEGTVYEERELVSYPEAVIQQSGKQYRLKSTELKEIPMEGKMTYVSAMIPYELEGEQQPPETVIMDFFDDQKKVTYQRELSFLEAEEKSIVWEETFEFPIIVSGVDADTFVLGTIEIPQSDDLTMYGSEFLKMLGLSEDYYRVNSIQWVSERYEKDGIFCRDAVGKGEKLIRTVDVKYGGQIRMPESIGYRYESVYEQIADGRDENTMEPERKEKEEVEATQVINMEEKNTSERIGQFVREHLAVITISVIFIVIMLGCIGILLFHREKTEKEKSWD